MIENGALSDDELDQFDQMLREKAAPGMNVERLDGYLSALACLPDPAMPSEYLSVIFDGEPQFDDHTDAEKAISFVLRHWNTIIQELQQGLKDVYELRYPVLLKYEGAGAGYDWACGFMQGATQRIDAYHEIVNSEEHGGMILAMMMFSHEQDVDLKTRTPPISDENRKEVMAMMVAGLNQIYRYFENKRTGNVSYKKTFKPIPTKRMAPKIGRNDPCPCESGKKFKHCCIDLGTTVH